MQICDTCSNECELQSNGEYYCRKCTHDELELFEMNQRNTFDPNQYLSLHSLAKNCMNAECCAVFTKDDYDSKINVNDDDEYFDYCIKCTNETKKSDGSQMKCGQCGAKFQKPDIDLDSPQRMCCNCHHKMISKLNINMNKDAEALLEGDESISVLEQESIRFRALQQEKFLNNRPNAEEVITKFTISKNETGHEGPFTPMGIFSMLNDAFTQQR